MLFFFPLLFVQYMTYSQKQKQKRKAKISDKRRTVFKHAFFLFLFPSLSLSLFLCLQHKDQKEHKNGQDLNRYMSQTSPPPPLPETHSSSSTKRPRSGSRSQSASPPSNQKQQGKQQPPTSMKDTKNSKNTNNTGKKTKEPSLPHFLTRHIDAALRYKDPLWVAAAIVTNLRFGGEGNNNNTSTHVADNNSSSHHVDDATVAAKGEEKEGKKAESQEQQSSSSSQRRDVPPWAWDPWYPWRNSSAAPGAALHLFFQKNKKNHEQANNQQQKPQQQNSSMSKQQQQQHADQQKKIQQTRRLTIEEHHEQLVSKYFAALASSGTTTTTSLAMIEEKIAAQKALISQQQQYMHAVYATLRNLCGEEEDEDSEEQKQDENSSSGKQKKPVFSLPLLGFLIFQRLFLPMPSTSPLAGSSSSSSPSSPTSLLGGLAPIDVDRYIRSRGQEKQQQQESTVTEEVFRVLLMTGAGSVDGSSGSNASVLPLNSERIASLGLRLAVGSLSLWGCGNADRGEQETMQQQSSSSNRNNSSSNSSMGSDFIINLLQHCLKCIEIENIDNKSAKMAKQTKFERKVALAHTWNTDKQKKQAQSCGLKPKDPRCQLVPGQVAVKENTKNSGVDAQEDDGSEGGEEEEEAAKENEVANQAKRRLFAPLLQMCAQHDHADEKMPPLQAGLGRLAVSVILRCGERYEQPDKKSSENHSNNKGGGGTILFWEEDFASVYYGIARDPSLPNTACSASATDADTVTEAHLLTTDTQKKIENENKHNDEETNSKTKFEVASEVLKVHSAQHPLVGKLGLAALRCLFSSSTAPGHQYSEFNPLLTSSSSSSTSSAADKKSDADADGAAGNKNGKGTENETEKGAEGSRHRGTQSGVCPRSGLRLRGFDFDETMRQQLLHDILHKCVYPQIEMKRAKYAPSSSSSSSSSSGSSNNNNDKSQNHHHAVHNARKRFDEMILNRVHNDATMSYVVDGANCGYFGLSSWYHTALEAQQQQHQQQSSYPLRDHHYDDDDTGGSPTANSSSSSPNSAFKDMKKARQGMDVPPNFENIDAVVRACIQHYYDNHHQPQQLANTSSPNTNQSPRKTISPIRSSSPTAAATTQTAPPRSPTLPCVPPMWARPCVFIHERHVDPRKMSRSNAAVLARWRSSPSYVRLYPTPNYVNDDLCWLYAAMCNVGNTTDRENGGSMKKNTAAAAATATTAAAMKQPLYLVTNDQCRDHHFSMLSPRLFLRWRAVHQMNYKKNPVYRHLAVQGTAAVAASGVLAMTLIPPPKFATWMQFNEGIGRNKGAPAEVCAVAAKVKRSRSDGGEAEGDDNANDSQNAAVRVWHVPFVNKLLDSDLGRPIEGSDNSKNQQKQQQQRSNKTNSGKSLSDSVTTVNGEESLRMRLTTTALATDASRLLSNHHNNSEAAGGTSGGDSNTDGSTSGWLCLPISPLP